MKASDACAIAGYIAEKDLIVPSEGYSACLVVEYRFRTSREAAWETRRRVIEEEAGEICHATMTTEFHPVTPG
jgi:hypothetical protein